MYLSFNVKDKDTSITDLQQHLTSIRNWCFNNSLLINPDKTKLIVFGTKLMISCLDDLDEVITSWQGADSMWLRTWSWNLRGSSVVLWRTYFKDTSCLPAHLVFIINALVFSRLFYCSSVWSNTAKKNVNKLQLVQNFAARIVVNKSKCDHVTPILKSLNWLPVKDQLYFRDAVLAFKCTSGLAPGYLGDQLIIRSNVSNRKTRNSQMI